MDDQGKAADANLGAISLLSTNAIFGNLIALTVGLVVAALLGLFLLSNGRIEILNLLADLLFNWFITPATVCVTLLLLNARLRGTAAVGGSVNLQGFNVYLLTVTCIYSALPTVIIIWLSFHPFESDFLPAVFGYSGKALAVIVSLIYTSNNVANA